MDQLVNRPGAENRPPIGLEPGTDGGSARRGRRRLLAAAALAIGLAGLAYGVMGRPATPVDYTTAPVEAGRSYHFVIERRDGRTVRFSVDEVEILTLTDPSPLAGPGHEHFGFNDWETPVCFDNLDITPLDG